MLLIGSKAYAQGPVSGRVTGREDGLPLAGVSVTVQGSKIGTQTGPDGRFAINVQPGSTLVFSYIGFITQEAAASANMNVSLVGSPNQMSEVVVLAYGSQKKEAITGSVATLSSKDLEKRTVTNITSALAGMAPGITVTSSNGQPGNSAGIRIRGFGSLSASSSPIIVLDGAVYDGSIGDLNQNDIESISVLKDASASALYGSRGANGVVIVTTKRGKSAQPTINANFSQGFSTRGIPEYDRVGTYEYYPFVWQAIKNNLMFSASPALSDAAASTRASTDVFTNLVYNPFNVPGNQVVGTDGKLNPNASLLYNDFDWYKPLTRTGKRTDANLSASGRTDKSDYLISMGYLNDQGFILKSDFQRFTARVNVNTRIKPWLKTGLNFAGTSSEGNTASDASTGNGSSFINAFSFSRGIGPIYPVHAFDASGNPIFNTVTQQQWYDYGIHPGAVNRPSGASPGRNVIYETLLNEVLYRRNYLSARTYFEIKILKDLTFTPSFSADLRNNNSGTFQNNIIGDGLTVNGSKSQSNNTIKSYTFNQILNYSKSFGDHNITALAGHENYSYNYRTFNAYRTGLILQGNTELVNFVTSNSSGGSADNDRIESIFSKVTYNYKEKYFLDGSLRRDGSSRFSPESRWGTFFSVGGSWSIGREDFLKSATWIDDLRLKASYGQVGNNQILSNGNNNYYADRAFYDLGWNNGSEPGALLASAANPELRWEKQNTFNAGVSFSLFGRRLTGELEVYKKTVNDLLFSVPLPLSDAVTSINRNIGSMYNAGIELQLGGDLVRVKNFNWNLLTNWTVFKNKITKMPEETPTIVSGTKRREKDHSIYDYYLRQYAGVDPSDGSALYIPADGTAAANIRTVNGVQYVTNQSFAKLDYTGDSAIPKLGGSFTNTFTYKNLSLSALVIYQIGGKAYDSVYQGLMSTSAYGSSYSVDILNSWTPANNTSNIPRADPGASTNTNATSTRWLIDASYLAIRNVNVSYTLPKAWLKKVDISNARLFVTGENLSLFSKRKGLNPSESFDGVNSNIYPQSRSISVGINFSL